MKKIRFSSIAVLIVAFLTSCGGAPRSSSSISVSSTPDSSSTSSGAFSSSELSSSDESSLSSSFSDESICTLESSLDSAETSSDPGSSDPESIESISSESVSFEENLDSSSVEEPSDSTDASSSSSIESSEEVSSSEESSSITRPTSGTEKIRIYATNDIHGQIYPENPDSSSGRVGIGKMMTYLNDQKQNEENVFLLDQGDTWQGSIYSNYHHGALITDLMNYVQYDARTVGNHDFDWGTSYVIENGKREYDGYCTPVLAANVNAFDFQTKTVGSEQRSDIGGRSVTYTLPSGLKIGIVGVIGEHQITSISSLYTRDIAFLNHIDVAKQEAEKLKKEGCDITILSVHAGEDDVLGNSLSEYYDLVLCGHTHRKEVSWEGNTPLGSSIATPNPSGI